MNGRILYKDICNDIINKIRTGVYKNGEYLPTQQQLCVEYSTSLITVKKAIESVEKAGLAVRRKGRKTVVVCTENIVLPERMQNVLFLDILQSSEKNLKEHSLKPPKSNTGQFLKETIAAQLPQGDGITSVTYTKDQILNDFENTKLFLAEKIIVFSGLDDELSAFFNSHKKQFLFYGNRAVENVCVVKNNDRRISEKAVKYLISLGHKRIAYIGLSDFNGDYSELYKGYRNAMTNASLPILSYLVGECKQPDVKSGYKAMNEILYSSIMRGTPTAVFCADDFLAQGAMQSVSENLLSCPEDISVLGVNNYAKLCEETNPPLSSIDKKFSRVAKLMVEFIVSDKWKNKKEVINCDLVIRDSVQEVKKENK